MNTRIKVYVAVLYVALSSFALNVAADEPQGLDGGIGYIHTHSADLYGRGFIGLNFQSFYNIRQVENFDKNEHRLIGSSAFTYGLSDELEYTAYLYAIAQGVFASSEAEKDRQHSGFGHSGMAIKYKMPFSSDPFSMSFRTAINFPMGYNFSPYPSYPFDTPVYELDLMLLQSFKFHDIFRLHINEGYRFRGLREGYTSRYDLLILNGALDYKLKDNLMGFTELSSWIELDDKVKPLEDRLILSQGVKYNTPWGFGVQGGLTLGLNKKRSDATQKRSENWRVFVGISFNTRSYHPDDDKDGVANAVDLEPLTPAGYPVDSKGRALDSDDDGVPDGADREKNTAPGASVDRFGKAIDSDNDGVPDGLDREPNTPTGAVVDVRGVAIDSDKDGVPDGIDLEPLTPAGTAVDLKGRALPPMEVELLTKGLLRVHKIYFNIGKSTIKPESFTVLNEIGRILQRHPDLKIRINGHTDATGSDELNMRLSLERADQVKHYLIQQFQDIIPEHIETKGHGRTKLLSNLNTEDAKTVNRRVEFEVLNMEELNERIK